MFLMVMDSVEPVPMPKSAGAEAHKTPWFSTTTISALGGS